MTRKGTEGDRRAEYAWGRASACVLKEASPGARLGLCRSSRHWTAKGAKQYVKCMRNLLFY